MGLLDDFGGFVKTPEGQGLLSAIAGGLAGARRGAPINSLGVAGLAGLQGYGKALENQTQEPLRQLQLQEAQAKLDEHKRFQDFIRTAPPEVQKAAGFGLKGADLYGIANPKPKISYHEGNVLNENMLTPEGMPTIVGKLPEAAPRPTSDIQNYQFDVSQGYKGTFNDWTMAQKRAGASSTTVSYGAPVAGVDPSGNPIFFQPSKDGKAPSIVPGVAPPQKEAKQPTEFQSKAGFYVKNMRAAEGTLDRLESEGMNMSKLGTQTEVMGAGNALGTFVVSPRAQQARQAQNQWSEQMLRMQTGAAATQQEIDRTVKTYFPQPGEGKETVALKKQMREQAMSGVNDAAGTAAPKGDVSTLPDFKSAAKAELERRRSKK